MCSPSAPPSPDYAGAAAQQGAANLQAGKQSSELNNPNVISPFGTQTYRQGNPDVKIKSLQDQLAGMSGLPDYETWRKSYPMGETNDQWAKNDYATAQEAQARQRRLLEADIASLQATGDVVTDRPTLVQKFSPEQQAIYDASTKAKLGMSELAGQGTEALKGIVGTGVDFSGAPPPAGQSEDARKRVLAGMMSRVNEDYGRQSDDLNSQLIAAGLRPGTKAYDDQMALLARKRTDANTQAELAAQQATASQFGLDTQARKDAIAEMLMKRQVPLNEITALLSGSQVTNPFATPGYAQNANIQAAPVFAGMQAGSDYATDIYNQKAAQAGNLQGGLFSLGSAAILGGMMGK